MGAPLLVVSHALCPPDPAAEPLACHSRPEDPCARLVVRQHEPGVSLGPRYEFRRRGGAAGGGGGGGGRGAGGGGRPGAPRGGGGVRIWASRWRGGRPARCRRPARGDRRSLDRRGAGGKRPGRPAFPIPLNNVTVLPQEPPRGRGNHSLPPPPHTPRETGAGGGFPPFPRIARRGEGGKGGGGKVLPPPPSPRNLGEPLCKGASLSAPEARTAPCLLHE